MDIFWENINDFISNNCWSFEIFLIIELLIWHMILMRKRVIKDFKNLPEEIRVAIREKYPSGYVIDLITFTDKDKQIISALPYETKDISYMIKMPSSLHIDTDEEEPIEMPDRVPGSESLENLDEEKYLIQEEEEEESD